MFVKNHIATSVLLFSASMSVNHLQAAEAADQEIDTVVITAKSMQDLENQGTSVNVITAEEISQSNAQSIKDVLVEVAGINLTSNSSSISGRQNISIRGSDSSHVLILVDGNVVSGTDAQIGHSDFQYNWVPMNAIERIEIVKGSSSALYGSQAIGGVINIITKKNVEKFNGNIGVKYGNSADDGGDLFTTTFNGDAKVTDKLSISVSAEKSDLDAVRDEDSSTTTKIEGKELVNGMVRFKYDLDETQSFEGSILSGAEDRYKVDDELYYDIERLNYSLGYNKDFGKNRLSVDGYVTDSDTHYNATSSYTHNLTNSVIRSELDFNSFDKHYLVAGAEYNLEEYSKEYDTSSSSDFSADRYNASLFFQDEYELNDDLILTYGSRFDYNEKFGAELSPKVNLLFKINERHGIRAGYGEGFLAPTLTENSSSYVASHGYVSFQGNDDLEAETSQSFEIGYEYNSDLTKFKAAIFQTEVDNLITYESISTYVYQYTNVDSATIKGFELEVSQEINKSNKLNLAYHYLQTEDDNGDELSYRPDHTLTARLVSSLPLGIQATFAANYTGEQYDGSDYYDSYTVYSTQFSKEFANQITARVGVDNLTNVDLDGEPNDIKGRLVYAGLNYAF